MPQKRNTNSTRSRSADPAPNADAAQWSRRMVFTTGEAAELCRVSQQTIIRCFDAGRISGFRVPGSKFRRIPRDELIRFMRENDIPTGALESPCRRALIVDPDPAAGDALAETLRAHAELDAVACAGLFDAGRAAERTQPDLILVSVGSDRGALAELCRSIRGSTPSWRVRLVAAVRSDDHPLQDACLRDGADAVVVIPADPSHLADALLDLIEN